MARKRDLAKADLGKAVVFLADRMGLSQKQLAALIRVSSKTISAWCNGERRPRPANMESVLRVLRCSRETVDDVAAYHSLWRSRMKQKADSVAEKPTATHPAGDELALEIGRAFLLVRGLLSTSESWKTPH